MPMSALLLLVLATACTGTPQDGTPQDGTPQQSTSPQSASPAATKPHELIRAERLQAHVDWLASDELQGRYAKSPQAKQAADYIVKELKSHGVEPFGNDGTFFQAIDEDEAMAPNVAGILRGKGEGYVLLTAHYDHLKPAAAGEDRIFNGADDNASGVSAVLENARAFSKVERPGASIVFLLFTAEEMGLRGSRFYVLQPPVPLEEMRGVFNMDMISRGEENLVFCEGGPKAPGPLGALKRANGTIGLELKLDKHPEWMSASDHYPFMQKGVPALYLGVEDHEDYHKVSDHADKVLPGLIEKVARLVFLAADDLARQPAPALKDPDQSR